jgi:hypothetical protein
MMCAREAIQPYITDITVFIKNIPPIRKGKMYKINIHTIKKQRKKLKMNPVSG